MPVVALGAQRRGRAGRPLLIKDAALGVAIVAEPPRLLAAINTWRAQQDVHWRHHDLLVSLQLEGLKQDAYRRLVIGSLNH